MVAAGFKIVVGIMRRYIRHPSDIPIYYCLNDADDKGGHPERLRDVSNGGLCFTTDSPLNKGRSIHIEIPLSTPPFAADGVVTWCRRDDGRYTVGVAFDELTSLFALRMIEQICHIERYRAAVLKQEHRHLTSEEAAREWIEKFAADFPSETLLESSHSDSGSE